MHKIFLQKWNECKFGVKERVKKDFSDRQIQYILETPTYNDQEKIKKVIESIENHAIEVEREARLMMLKIKSF